MDERFFVERLEAGRDFAVRDGVAASMGNLVYLLGDRVARECLVVDPAWDVPGILSVVDRLELTLTGALVTHWHPDHAGGDLMGHDVEGVSTLLRLRPVPVHVHGADVEFLSMFTGVPRSELSVRADGDVVRVGEVEVQCLHTPGHTAGSQCFRCRQALVSGDTLFFQGCGRTDLPGGDVEEMWRTLHERLGALPRDLVLFPGHHYGVGPGRDVRPTLSEVERANPVLRAPSRASFLRMFGAA